MYANIQYCLPGYLLARTGIILPGNGGARSCLTIVSLVVRKTVYTCSPWSGLGSKANEYSDTKTGNLSNSDQLNFIQRELSDEEQERQLSEKCLQSAQLYFG